MLYINVCVYIYIYIYIYVYIYINTHTHTSTESSALPCPALCHYTIYHYTMTIALGWKAGVRRKELGLEMVVQQ